jgi:hypothetical protein
VTEGQRDRVGTVGPDSMWRIPDGSWLIVRRDARGTWVEVLDPEASALLAFDFASDEQLRSRLPEGGDV